MQLKITRSQIRQFELRNHLSSLYRKHPNHPINGHTNDTFTLVRRTRSDDLDSNVDRRLLAETDDLGTSAPIPAYKCLVCSSGYEIFGRERDGADAVKVARELLERCECDR
jgi:hypothetical protein